MAKLRILSAGAAQAVTERIVESFKRDTGAEVTAEFSAVGEMKARVMKGEPVDVITLTRTMIDELIADGFIQPGSRFDLGKVGTGVAVRAGMALPKTGTADELRAAVLSATKIVCPDPATATAGRVVMAALEKLGITYEVRDRLQFFPNGYAAMRWLAAEGGARDLGITQATEILPNKGVSYAGPLPDTFQQKATYSAGVAARAKEPQLAKDFVGRFAAARALLLEAGYELD
jgi:molybdate transport system substrate-binding protein